MKTNFTDKKTIPVPRRGRVVLIAGLMMIFAASVAAGAITAPEESEIPVILADGSVITPPWYITVDGKKEVLVDSQETAAKVMQDVIDVYSRTDNVILDIEIKEKTSFEKMDIKSGDEAPEILNEVQAKAKLLGDDETAGCLTVVTTEEETDEETVAFEEKYRPEPEMYAGQTKIQVQGEDGLKEIKKKVVRENGKAVTEEIIEEEVVEEPVEQVVLTGTKGYDGYGGGSGSADTGVSYDKDASYEDLRIPVDSVYVSSGYGMRWGRLHRGTDFALPTGSSIYAADEGTVYCAGYSGSYGNLVKIDHGNGMQTYYAHCSQIMVSDGQHVECGEVIAKVGSTGNSTGPHLHFEVIINGSCVDPVSMLDL
ncbi:MAG: peptidoglycan DD-metalloendopeptidase family protein [Lentihominibacter sp.]